MKKVSVSRHTWPRVLCLCLGAGLVSVQAAAKEVSHGEEGSTRSMTSSAAALASTDEVQLGIAASTTDNANHVIYDAVYFAQYNPRHALDMVDQTPGFSLSSETNRRGFSGAVGNLLIDGLRPNTKSQTASDILSRIPAEQVLRIELLRGAAVAGDPSGASTLLNMVRRPSVGSGIWDLGAEYGATPDIGPRGNMAYSGRKDQVEYGISASVSTVFREDDAYRRLFDESGNDQRYIETPESHRSTDSSLSADIALPLWGGRVRSTAQFILEESDSRRQFIATDVSETLIYNQDSNSVDDDIQSEIGLNYDRLLGAWDISLIGLINREKNTSDDTTIRRDGFEALIGNTKQERAQNSGETILRLTAGTAISGHLLRFGVEGALNTLEQESDFFEDHGAGAELIEVPNSNISVEEERADIFASHTWTPNERWSMETRVGWETSTLTFTGDADQSVDLSYWKPSLQIVHTIGAKNQLRFRLYRDVGQLNFGNFVSAVSISENRIDGGNPDLRPTTSLRMELGADFRFDNNAAFALTLAHHRFDDVEDQVLIVEPGKTPGDPPIRFDALGNIGDGTRTLLEASLLYPLDFILTGAQITLEGTLQETEVTDPITGRPREISRVPGNFLNFGFRHDLASGRMAWGFSWEKGNKNSTFRYDEINVSETDAWITAFVETSALPHNMQLRLLVEDIGRRATTNDLRYFSPDRAGLQDGLESRHLERSSAPWFLLELSGQF